MAPFRFYIVDINKFNFSERDDRTLISPQNIRFFGCLALLDPVIKG